MALLIVLALSTLTTAFISSHGKAADSAHICSLYGGGSCEYIVAMQDMQSTHAAH